jgi:hypothetical protein
VARTAGGRAADPIARAAWEVHPNNPVQGTARRVARRIGRTKYRDDWCGDRRCEVHRARVPGDQKVESLEDRRQREQIETTGNIDHL